MMKSTSVLAVLAMAATANAQCWTNAVAGDSSSALVEIACPNDNGSTTMSTGVSTGPTTSDSCTNRCGGERSLDLYVEQTTTTMVTRIIAGVASETYAEWTQVLADGSLIYSINGVQYVADQYTKSGIKTTISDSDWQINIVRSVNSAGEFECSFNDRNGLRQVMETCPDSFTTGGRRLLQVCRNQAGAVVACPDAIVEDTGTGRCECDDQCTTLGDCCGDINAVCYDEIPYWSYAAPETIYVQKPVYVYNPAKVVTIYENRANEIVGEPTTVTIYEPYTVTETVLVDKPYTTTKVVRKEVIEYEPYTTQRVVNQVVNREVPYVTVTERIVYNPEPYTTTVIIPKYVDVATTVVDQEIVERPVEQTVVVMREYIQEVYVPVKETIRVVNEVENVQVIENIKTNIINVEKPVIEDVPVEVVTTKIVASPYDVPVINKVVQNVYVNKYIDVIEKYDVTTVVLDYVPTETIVYDYIKVFRDDIQVVYQYETVEVYEEPVTIYKEVYVPNPIKNEVIKQVEVYVDEETTKTVYVERGVEEVVTVVQDYYIEKEVVVYVYEPNPVPEVIYSQGTPVYVQEEDNVIINYVAQYEDIEIVNSTTQPPTASSSQTVNYWMREGLCYSDSAFTNQVTCPEGSTATVDSDVIRTGSSVWVTEVGGNRVCYSEAAFINVVDCPTISSTSTEASIWKQGNNCYSDSNFVNQIACPAGSASSSVSNASYYVNGGNCYSDSGFQNQITCPEGSSSSSTIYQRDNICYTSSDYAASSVVDCPAGSESSSTGASIYMYEGVCYSDQSRTTVVGCTTASTATDGTSVWRFGDKCFTDNSFTTEISC